MRFAGSGPREDEDAKRQLLNESSAQFLVVLGFERVLWAFPGWVAPFCGTSRSGVIDERRSDLSNRKWIPMRVHSRKMDVKRAQIRTEVSQKAELDH